MNRPFRFLLLAGLLCGPASFRPARAETWLVRDARIVSPSRPPIERGSILIRDGVIAEVGAQVSTPPDARVVEGNGLTVYPGLIDLHTSLAQPEQIQADKGPQNPTQPNLSTAEGNLKAVPTGVTPAWRVESVLQAASKDLDAARRAGVALALSVPGQGCVPGRGAFIYTLAAKNEELPAASGGKAAPVCFQFSSRIGRYPNTLMAQIAAQRQILLDAQRYQLLRARDPKTPVDPTLEALGPLLAGEQPAYFIAGRERDIRRALSLAAEFHLRPVIAGGDEASRVLPELKASGATVLFSLGAVPASPPAGRPDPAAIPAALSKAGIPFALTSQGLKGYQGFQAALSRVAGAGLSEELLVRALTTEPAQLLGVDERFGGLMPGQSANLTLTSTPLVSPAAQLRRLFVRGVPVDLTKAAETPAAAGAAAAAPAAVPAAAPAAPAAVAEPARADTGVVLIRNGTLLTVTRGVIKNGSILIRNGRIAAIGPDASIHAPADARVIDATGKWVMPGIVDAHSHMALDGGINEGTYSITPEVRVLDILNPKDVTIYRALAGGVTSAHLMHGSANVIGGQNAIVKLKWGHAAADLPIPGAPRTVKFALGENPKRSNFTTGAAPPRYPTTRMGVEAMLRESFNAARGYQAEWKRYEQATMRGENPVPPRRDLRLEALSDIMSGKILVQAHSYRADEILMLLRLAEEFGFKIKTLHHALEAYKVAPEIAKHGAGVSTFADNWAYKVEAFDAIPHNAALCARAGVRVSVNSDSNERVRRLYWEAAKCIKYGGMSETEALKTITLNPAWQLGIDQRVGSLEVSKDADIAIFSAHPFAAATLCELTLVEGEILFDRKKDLEMRGKPGYPSPDVEGTLNIGSDDECDCER